jgi:predicted permease
MTLAAGNGSIMNWVILASAVVPVLVVVIGSWFFLRAGRRHDERERSLRR